MLLVGHPRPLFNAGYQVIEVHHDGYQPLPGLGAEGEGPEQGINTRFIALPGDVFRAPCVTLGLMCRACSVRWWMVMKIPVGHCSTSMVATE
jgi:hypothetical protein